MWENDGDLRIVVNGQTEMGSRGLEYERKCSVFVGAHCWAGMETGIFSPATSCSDHQQAKTMEFYLCPKSIALTFIHPALRSNVLIDFTLMMV